MAADLSASGRRKNRLQAELHLLGHRYGDVNYDRMDGAWVHIPNFGLPPGWDRASVEILIDIPYGIASYPSEPPHWFWTDRDLRTAEGRSIGHFFTQKADSHTDRMYLDRNWGHFCVYVKPWRPASGLRLKEGHTLLSYLDVIEVIFRDRKTLAL